MAPSKSGRFNLSDLIESLKYLLSIVATLLLANQSGVTDFLTQYVGIERAGVIVTALGIVLKRFITNYTKTNGN